MTDQFAVMVNTGRGFAIMAHRDRTEWTRRTAIKHAREFNQAHGKAVCVVRAEDAPNVDCPVFSIG